MAATASCSAPGKVLLAGGYLILDRPHAGAVIALDARFHTSVELVPLSAFASSSSRRVASSSERFRAAIFSAIDPFLRLRPFVDHQLRNSACATVAARREICRAAKTV